MTDPTGREANQESRTERTTAAKRSGRADRPERGTMPEATLGGELERRVGRVEFAEGALVRLRVPIPVDSAEGERAILTDADVLTIDVDRRLRLSKSVLECKSGRGQSGETYTAVWLAGLRELLGLDRAVLVRRTISTRGRTIARRLKISIYDDKTLREREMANGWLPEKFAHLDGEECLEAERRTDRQLKGLPEIPTSLASFLRFDALLAPSHALLSAVNAYGEAVRRQGAVPDPAASVLASHALICVLLAALQDAGQLDEYPAQTLKDRLIRGLTVGDPNDSSVLTLLERADELVNYYIGRLHRTYSEAGASPQPIDVPSLRATVASPPDYLDSYIDLVGRLRANSQVGQDLLQTAELACFEGLLGAEAWQAPAFRHLFTSEHRGLLLNAVTCLSRVGGNEVAASLRGLWELPFDGSDGKVPDRRNAGGVVSTSGDSGTADRTREPEPDPGTSEPRGRDADGSTDPQLPLLAGLENPGDPRKGG